MTKFAGQPAAVWPANALIIGVLLRLSPNNWPVKSVFYAAAGCFGLIVADFCIGFSAVRSLLMVAGDIVEILIFVYALRRVCQDGPDLTRIRDLLYFVGIGGGLAPIVSGIFSSLMIAAALGDNFFDLLTNWYPSDALGILMITPAIVTFSAKEVRRFVSRVGDVRNWAPLACVGLSMAATVAFPQLSLHMLLLPSLLYCGVQLGAPVTAMILLATGVVLTGANLYENSLHSSRIFDSQFRLHTVQSFFALQTILVLPVSAVISERLRNGRFQQVLVDNIPASVGYWDTNLRRTFSNQRRPISPGGAGLEVGHPPLAEASGLDVRDLDPLHIAAVLGGRPEAFELSTPTPSGAVAHTLVHLAPDFGDDGEVLGFFAISTDITVVKESQLKAERLNRELNRALAEAEKLARAKSEFLANMSHEIRTPLTAIIGLTELIADRSRLDDAPDPNLTRIRGACRVLLSLVNDVLDLSRIEAGETTLHYGPVDIAAIAMESVSLFQDQAEAKGVSLEMELGPKIPAWLELDGDRMRQILINLLSNAVKFTEVGHVKLDVRYDHTGEQLQISVSDTGPGLTQLQQQKLFQRFSQIDSTPSKRHGGAGLGLAICRGLVEAMKGQILVRSTVGQGSEFIVLTPAKIMQIEEAAEPDEASGSFAGMRVLVVDDNQVNRELARVLLEALEIEVEEAEGGQAGIETALSRPFDAILMDIRMPDIDGLAAAARIRASVGPNRSTPILAFTADVGREGASQWDDLFSGVIRKPINPSEVAYELSRGLGA